MLRSKMLLAVVFTALSQIFFAQLSGVATLANQSNHSGIKVKFIANSGTAVTDSTLTDASGNYSINIAGGVYYVQMSKAGYQTIFYNNNVSLLLNNSTTLNSCTLQAGVSVINVSGSVSGNWTNSNIYKVVGQLDVTTGGTLIIQPGTTVQIAGHYTIATGGGVLIANGTPAEPILFTSASPTPAPGDWECINLFSPGSSVTNCIIEYAVTGLQQAYINQPIMWNEVRKFSTTGIISSGLVKYNKVHDFQSPGTGSVGIQLNTFGQAECNEVYNGYGHGIRTSGSYSQQIRNNVVHHITDPSNNFGIGIAVEWGDAAVSNNIVYGCRTGIGMSASQTSDPKSKATNNTVHSNVNGIVLGYGCCNVNSDVVNNIVINNQFGITQGAYPINTSAVSHNCVWNNSSNNYNAVNITAIGQTVTTNSNGDPVDSYYNISLDPEIVNNTLATLNSTSPCFAAGNSNYSPNIGCNTSLICSNIAIGINEIQKGDLDFSVYPNPFENEIYLMAKKEKLNLRLFDLLGKAYHIDLVGTGDDKVRLSTEQLQPGVYFLQINSGSAIKIVKLIKN